MAGITLANAEAQLQLWLTASEKVASGQEYRMGDRWLRRSDADHIQSMIEFWDSRAQKLSRASGLRIRKAVPLG